MAGRHGPVGWAACLVQARIRVSVYPPSGQLHTQITVQMSPPGRSLGLALGPMSHQFLLGATLPLVGSGRGKWARPAHQAYPGPAQGFIHDRSCSVLTPTPHSFPRKWNSINKGLLLPLKTSHLPLPNQNAVPTIVM